MIQAVFFDLDGTLIDSVADLAESVNRMLDQQGHPRQPLEVFPQFIGEGLRQLVQSALPSTHQDVAYIDHCVEIYKTHYTQLWHDQTRPFAGIQNLLDQLRERGIPLACISNKTHHFTQLCCAHFFPSDTFASILGQRDSVPRKPAPDAALECATALAVPIQNCAYVGDSGIDMQFAQNAGMVSIGVSWGLRSLEELLQHGAQHIVHTPAEILDLVR
jgi:phosphoglycolate phosphatase